MLRARGSPRDAEASMPTLRPEQVVALHRQPALRAFVVEMIDHLRRHQGPEVAELDDGELGAHIEACLWRAGDHGLASRRDCARFVSLAACMGWAFDLERPWVHEELTNPVLGPSERLARVYDRCVRELESEAQGAARKHQYGI